MYCTAQYNVPLCTPTVHQYTVLTYTLISQRLPHTMFLELCNLFSEENKFLEFCEIHVVKFGKFHKSSYSVRNFYINQHDTVSYKYKNVFFLPISDTPPVYRKMWALWNPKSGIKQYIALYRSALYHLLWGIKTMLFFEKIKGVHRNMILRHFCKIRFSILWVFSCEFDFRVL
jgi:hypothetical protein